MATATEYTVIILDHQGKPALSDNQVHDALEHYDCSVVDVKRHGTVDPGEGWD